ncbi:hypothetical protein [Actinomadura opuntiae]|uniref:hypothetical protein n=1 Tax=Actinomadura sp. OS1-43 TaxID=604315 RepID=UPI00255A742C|nr:hypothetical protein [Actinomadura sp. OS1-43]MDL4820771.1 hypothetical protein [Actinomadura sp. OS1-43]
MLIVVMATVACVTVGVANLAFMVLALPFALNAWRFHRESVQRDDDGVIVRRLRDRRILWSQVSEVKAEQGITGRHIVLGLHSGRAVVLPVPCDLGPVKERAFEEKAAALRSWRSE